MTAVVLRNADVRIMDERGTRAHTLAFRGGVIIDEHEAGTDARIIDLGGRIVVPGFIDAHTHIAIAALYGGAKPFVAPRVTDVPSFQRALAAESERLSPGEWLVVTEWNEELLAEGRAPTRAELDEALPDRPLFALHYSCHRALANSAALEQAGIDRHTPSPSGGAIERGRDGIPSGVLVERGMSAVEDLARRSLLTRDAEGFYERVGQHYRAMVAAGITRVVDAMVPEPLAIVLEEADRRGLVLVPTTLMPGATVGGYLDAPWSALELAPTGAARGNLRVGPLKLVFDGAPACAMCLGWWQVAAASIGAIALTLRQRSLAPIRTSMSVGARPGWKVRSGILMYEPTASREIVEAALDKGFAVATHAIGNAAIDLALEAYAAAKGALHTRGVARLEHASFLSRAQIARIADLGIAVVTQPHFVTLPAVAHAPPVPGITYQPLRSLLEAGVTVAGSSDYPVASFDPLAAVRSAVRRRTMLGNVHEPAERIELDEALALYTRHAARATGSLDECGTLEPGKRADLVVLDGLDVDDLRVYATVVGGETLAGSLEHRPR